MSPSERDRLRQESDQQLQHMQHEQLHALQSELAHTMQVREHTSLAALFIRRTHLFHEPCILVCMPLCTMRAGQ